MIFSEEEAQNLLRVVLRASTLIEAIQNCVEAYPKFAREIRLAIEKLFCEVRPRIEANIASEWWKFTGGFLRLDEIDEKIAEFCHIHNVDEEAFRAWFEGKTKVEPKADITPKKLAQYINYLKIRNLLSRAIKIELELDEELIGYVYKKIVYLTKSKQPEIVVEGNLIKVKPTSKTINIAPVLPLARKIRIYLKTRIIELSGEELGYDAAIKLFDSKWEKELYDSLVEAGLEVRREPIIIIGDKKFVVDYIVIGGEKQVYVELVGYWRQSYLINKEIKIRNALKHNFPVWIVAHEKTKEYMKHLNTKKFYFKHKKHLKVIAKKIADVLYTR